MFTGIVTDIGTITAVEQRGDMRVVVSTAYMDEAGRFERLVAMDAGRVLAQGSPASLMERTGAASLEEAYIALLPPAAALCGAAFAALLPYAALVNPWIRFAYAETAAAALLPALSLAPTSTLAIYAASDHDSM